MPFNPVQNINQGLALAGNIQQQQQQNQVNALQQGIAQQTAQGGFNPNESLDFQQLAALDPNNSAQTLSTFNSISDSRKKAMFQDTREARRLLEVGDGNGFLGVVSSRLENIERLGGDPSQTLNVLQAFNSGDVQGAFDMLSRTEQVGIDMGLLSDPLDRELKRAKAKAGGKSSRMRELDSLISLAEADPDGETIKGKAALIELGLIARVSTSAEERIAENEVLANKVVKVAGEKSAAQEGAKLGQQLIHKPGIISAVKVAEKEAIERGDVLTSLSRSQAALPGLMTAVTELKELAQISTSTFGGKIFDQAVKQSGFGTTKGATARAKFIAIVNNQVLPLLKETFGAAFTAQEGEALKATMGDPDSSTDEKMAQLDAFVDQKVRDIETKQRQLGQPASPQQTGEFAGFKVVR